MLNDEHRTIQRSFGGNNIGLRHSATRKSVIVHSFIEKRLNSINPRARINQMATDVANDAEIRRAGNRQHFIDFDWNSGDGPKSIITIKRIT